MGAKYLCCLPLRLGVLVIAGLQTLASGVAAGFQWYALIALRDEPGFSTQLKIVTGVVATLHTIIAIVSLLGFLGAIRKKISFVSLYAVVSAWLLGVSIGMAIITIVLAFTQTREQFVKACINGSTDPTVIHLCSMRRATPGSKLILTISLIIPILFQAYGVYIIRAYAKKLVHKENHKLVANLGKGAYMPTSTHDEDSKPLTHSYPYGDAVNSYGNTHADTSYGHDHV